MVNIDGKDIKIVAIIPARAGSKRIPHKNIKDYAGKPLIYWSINLAKQSKLVDDVVVTTDNYKIAEIAKSFGASVPFLRPSKISGDLSTDYEFIEHYINWLMIEAKEDMPNIIVHLRPTYPNRKLEVLDDCIKKYIGVYGEYDSLRTVCEMDKPAFKMYTMRDNVLIPLFDKIGDINEPYNMPAQILPKSYWHNGYIDIMKVDTIIDKKSVTGDKIYPYLMDKDEIDDIDTMEEWKNSEKKAITIHI